MMKARSLLYAALLASLSAFGEGQATAIPGNMSDELFRASIYSALQRGPSDPSKPSFSTSDTQRMFLSQRFPLGGDLRHPKIPLGDNWTLGLTRDQYGRSLGFSHTMGNKGTLRFGLIRENISNIPNRTTAGVSFSYSW